MKLVASLIVKNEAGRYLDLVLRQLSDFCDEIRVLNDASEDHTLTVIRDAERNTPIRVCSDGPSFDEHEGAARDCLFEWTLDANPTHVLSIDADEFVSDPAAIRRSCNEGADAGVWTLDMTEVWQAAPGVLQVREDGGWRTHPVPSLYRVPDGRLDVSWWQIEDKPLACGREPLWVRWNAHAAHPSGSSILHFGWARESERQRRYTRYMTLDSGAYHNRDHLESILRPADLAPIPWPAALVPYREGLIRRAAQ